MKATFTYWKESDGRYLGCLNSHPAHWTQGEDFEDLKAHLRDLHEMFSAEDIPGIRKVAELEVAGNDATLSPASSATAARCCDMAQSTTFITSRKPAGPNRRHAIA
ncbi:MAG TPA: hypothetical protein VG710_02045 [Opitutus sp.]|nr:hypothetical protein [Opitutus sp.]